MHCLKMHGVAAPKKSTMTMHAFNLLQTKLLYMFCLYFEPYIFVGLQQTTGLPYLMHIFPGNASLFSSVCFSSVVFVWSYKVMLSSF